ncbi:MAG TPA: NnrS family protein [Alphaproteobacteria bacterium]|jgi:uncharacterized protein involved in response to NO
MTAISNTARPAPAPTFFERGFRPFFLLAGLHATLWLAAWVGVLQGWLEAPEAWPPSTLHGHEMIFGFASAALAGFLLTAVPSWTNSGPLRGWKLALLVLLWLAARVAAAAGADPRLYAALDLAFVPALFAAVGPGIIARNLKRNGIVLVVLTAILAANAGAHLGVLGAPFVSARWGNDLGLSIFILLIALIGGRIIPPFTMGGMRMAGHPVELAPTPWLDRAVMAATAAWAVSLALDLPEIAVGIVAAVAAFAHGARLLRWRSLATLRVPLVWVLHLGYAWLVLGLAAAAGAGLGAWPKAVALHALGAGAVATMILAVMSRASLGHTGRKLVASVPTTIAYLLVTIGAAGRVAASLIEIDVAFLLPAAGLVWAAGFLIYVVVYVPVLCRPRVDGRPG